MSTVAMTDQQVQELFRKGKGDEQTTRQHDYVSLFSLENQAKNTVDKWVQFFSRK